MKKFLPLLTASIILAGCGQSTAQTASPPANLTEPSLSNTTDESLFINAELAALFPYEVSISLEHDYLMIESFPENRVPVHFTQSVIEYFDGSDWVTAVDLAERFPLPFDFQTMEIGVSSSRRTYEFSWLRDAGFDVENGQFRVRQRLAFDENFTDPHDWVVNFSLAEIGKTIINQDLAGDMLINPEFENVRMEVKRNGNLLNGTIINGSDTTISPSHPSLEYFDGQDWRFVPGNIAFRDIGFSIAPGRTHQFTVDLDWYDLPNDVPLRLRKTIFPDGSYPYGWNETERHHDLGYEFTN